MTKIIALHFLVRCQSIGKTGQQHLETRHFRPRPSPRSSRTFTCETVTPVATGQFLPPFQSFSRKSWRKDTLILISIFKRPFFLGECRKLSVSQCSLSSAALEASPQWRSDGTGSFDLDLVFFAQNLRDCLYSIQLQQLRTCPQDQTRLSTVPVSGIVMPGFGVIMWGLITSSSLQSSSEYVSSWGLQMN